MVEEELAKLDGYEIQYLTSLKKIILKKFEYYYLSSFVKRQWPELALRPVSCLWIFFFFFRLNYIIVRPSIIYGIADRQGLSKLLHHFWIYFFMIVIIK